MSAPPPSRVLIVDDNALNLELASFLLKAEGWKVQEAKATAEALHCLDAFEPDVVLLDIQLPDVDGLTASRLIRERLKGRVVPIIAFTAYAMRGDKAKLLAAGCDGYIAKPIEVANFVAEVRQQASQALSPLSRLFYISDARIDPTGPEPRRIIDVGSARNSALNVTGVLYFSGDHFAQVLEGGHAALSELMGSIRKDVRHHITHEWPIAPAHDGRWFEGWALGYVFDARLQRFLSEISGAAGALPPFERLARQLATEVDLFKGRQNP